MIRLASSPILAADVLPKKMKEIETLWNEHKTTAFPSICRGEEVDGIDLVMLDADIAACVSTFLGAHDRLDQQRIEILRRCRNELTTVVPRLPANTREHYLRLQRMADLVLNKLK